MRIRIMLGILLSLSSCLRPFGQSRQTTIRFERQGTTDGLEVNSYFPLRDALVRVCQEYGWLVSYEDAIYTAGHIQDIAVPSWHRNHPGERGFYVPQYRTFIAHLGRPVNSEDERTILESLVSQYNNLNSGNYFRVVIEGHNIAIAEGTRGGRTFGDAIVQPATEGQTALKELERVLRGCSVASGLNLQLGTVSINALNAAFIKPATGPLTCRQAIWRVIAAADRTLVYQINDDINDSSLIVNIIPMHRFTLDQNGKEQLVPLQ